MKFIIALIGLAAATPAFAAATPAATAAATCSPAGENCLKDSDCCSGSTCDLALEQCIFQGDPGEQCLSAGQQCFAFGETFPPCCDGLSCDGFSETCS